MIHKVDPCKRTNLCREIIEAFYFWAHKQEQMEPLKNMFSRELVAGFSADVRAVQKDFPTERFLAEVFDARWDTLELKQRVRHISLCLRLVLPADYREALQVLVDVTKKYLDTQGEKMSFFYTFLPDFVEIHGADDPDASLPALEIMTCWSSAEFAVRPFLLRYPERMYAQMLTWSRHSSPMVRRLSSEGIRPRLPWGMGVPALKRDPSPILPILENLKNDPAETVRRSVANNLNDISKDHPALVLEIAARWLGLSPETDWIIKHASRGLLKKGNVQALAHFGFQNDIEGIEIHAFHHDAIVRIGERLDFSFQIRNTAQQSAAIRLEYGIDYQTLSGKTSIKVFKIKELNLKPDQTENISKYQRFQDFTTRKHFSGPHVLRIIVNGKAMAEGVFHVE
jgi:3-methyladenine DNA glycosylase AlkC